MNNAGIGNNTHKIITEDSGIMRRNVVQQTKCLLNRCGGYPGGGCPNDGGGTLNPGGGTFVLSIPRRKVPGAVLIPGGGRRGLKLKKKKKSSEKLVLHYTNAKTLSSKKKKDLI